MIWHYHHAMKEQFVNMSEGEKPLIYAYIGTQDPMRGDSKARVGIAKAAAEILGGKYIYVDEAILKDHFPNAKDFKERLQRFIQENGRPDLLVGHDYLNLFSEVQSKPVVSFAHVPESIASLASDKGYTPNQLQHIVAHDLTQEALEREAEIFRARYQNLKGPIVAVMMGGDLSKTSVTKAAKAIRKIAKNYDDLSIFVCPSRRTHEKFDEFMGVMRDGVPAPFHLDTLMDQLKKAFNIQSRTPEIAWSDRLQLRGVTYDECVSDYNPYAGLLGSADHIVVLGRSQSLVSEALFTGKTIMHAGGPHCEMHSGLHEVGIIKSLEGLASTGRFDTQNIAPISTVHESAEKLVKEYKDELGLSSQSL